MIKKIKLRDDSSGKTVIKDAEYFELASDDVVASYFVRMFAKTLVENEWITNGLAENDFEEGFKMISGKAKDYAKFQFECIEREKRISIEINEENHR